MIDMATLKVGDVIINPTSDPTPPWVMVEGVNRSLYMGMGKHQTGAEVVHPTGRLLLETLPPTAELSPTPKEYQGQLRKEGYPVLAYSTSNSAGMDPEVFAVDEKGECIPAFEFLPEKKNGIVTKLEDRGYGNINLESSKSFYDGFQAEFTIASSGCHGYVTDFVRHGLRTVWSEARKYRPGATLSIESVLPLTREQLTAAGKEHIKLGCAPSMNAYGEEPLAVPAAEDLLMRFAGAHMHFGAAIPPECVTEVVKLLDAVAGVAMVGMGEGYTRKERRMYYGRAGEYRYHYKTDGYNNTRLEYRVPDTLLLSHPATFNAVWDFTRVVFHLGLMGLNFLWDAGEDEVREAINENNVKLARDILTRNNHLLHRIMEKSNPSWGATNDEWVGGLEKLFMEGLGEVVAHPEDVVGNWWLERPVAPYVKEVDYESTPQDQWIIESYARKPKYWDTGRIWSSACRKVVKGERV